MARQSPIMVLCEQNSDCIAPGVRARSSFADSTFWCLHASGLSRGLGLMIEAALPCKARTLEHTSRAENPVIAPCSASSQYDRLFACCWLMRLQRPSYSMLSPQPKFPASPMHYCSDVLPGCSALGLEEVGEFCCGHLFSSRFDTEACGCVRPLLSWRYLRASIFSSLYAACLRVSL